MNRFSNYTNTSTNDSKWNRKRRRFITAQVLIFAFVLLAVVIGGGVSIAGYFQENTYANCVVNSKENTYNVSSKTMEKRIYTENCGVFTVNDDPARLNFNSADTYGKVKEGEAYTFTATGYRIPLLSMFPNIITIK